jgi:hypothetical protein
MRRRELLQCHWLQARQTEPAVAGVLTTKIAVAAVAAVAAVDFVAVMVVESPGVLIKQALAEVPEATPMVVSQPLLPDTKQPQLGM